MQSQVEMSHSLQYPTSRGRRKLKGTLTKGQLTISVRSGTQGPWSRVFSLPEGTLSLSENREEEKGRERQAKMRGRYEDRQRGKGLNQA